MVEGEGCNSEPDLLILIFPGGVEVEAGLVIGLLDGEFELIGDLEVGDGFMLAEGEFGAFEAVEIENFRSPSTSCPRLSVAS